MKQRVSGSAPVRPASMVEHLDVGLRQAPEPAFGNCVVTQHIKPPIRRAARGVLRNSGYGFATSRLAP